VLLGRGLAAAARLTRQTPANRAPLRGLSLYACRPGL